MFGLGMTELLVILAIVLLVFGPKRLKNIGSDLGSAIKGFRSAVSEEDKAEDKDASAAKLRSSMVRLKLPSLPRAKKSIKLRKLAFTMHPSQHSLTASLHNV